MPLERDPATVLDIVIAARRIQQFIAEQTFEDFHEDLKTQSAVVFQILILGEAAKRLSQEFRDRYPQVAWSSMMRMRDKLIHHYERIDPMEIWTTAIRDVPELLAMLEPLLPAQEG